MTVLEAMNLFGLDERPTGLADLELAMARALKQTPRQRELLEEAARCLSADLETRASSASHLTSIERHPTREILLFDENRDAVMFGDEVGPELPVSFQAPLVDDSAWLGDDSVIFEGEAAMMSEFVTDAPSALLEPSADLSAETLDALPRPDTSISGEWQLMLESLEAEGLVKPEEGFSDALSAQIVALHDTPPERLAANPDSLGLDSPIFAPPEPEGPAMSSPHAALLETPLFSTPLFATPLLLPAQPEILGQSASGLETPLFAASPLATVEQAQVITFDESLLISHGALSDDLQRSTDQPASLAVTKSLETLPSRKMPEATPLSIKSAAAQPSEPFSKPVTGRAGIAPASDAPRTERRNSRSPTVQTTTPRTYRDAREPTIPLRRRRQPVALWLLSVAVLLGSAVFIAPNLAAQLRDQLLPGAAAPIKPTAATKPQVRVVKPAAITPIRRLSSPAKTVKPAAQPSVSKPSASKPSANKPSASQPTVSKPILSTKPTAPRVAAVVSPPSSAVATPPRAVPVVKAVKPVRQAPRVTAAVSSASSLPPVTRPEGFASSGVTKPVIKPVVSIKPAVKPTVKPVPKPAPPAPVASIEYQDKPVTAAAGELPGGLSRQEFGRQFLNRKQFEVWQSQQLSVRFESFAQIPLETQVLEADAFRAAVLIPTVRPTRPERP